MSSGVDLSQFYDTFFDEADELLAEMERHLLELDVDEPDKDELNAIFRAAHSIKGGAATFGTFAQLADTTHLLENLLDFIRDGDMALNQGLIDLFLESKDVLSDQVLAYRSDVDPDEEATGEICARLTAITEAHLAGEDPLSVAEDIAAGVPLASDEKGSLRATANSLSGALNTSTDALLRVHMRDAMDTEVEALRTELAMMGEVISESAESGEHTFLVDTDVPIDAIRAVCGLIVSESRLTVHHANEQVSLPVAGNASGSGRDMLTITITNASEADLAVLRDEMMLMGELLDEKKDESGLTLWLETDVSADDIAAVCQFIVSEEQVLVVASTVVELGGFDGGAAEKVELKTEPSKSDTPIPATAPPKKKAAKKTASAAPSRAESTTLRVDVDKIDQIINLVGELVITQAMLVQTASELDPVEHGRLLSGVEQLERNARDLQESVMSIRMMPMDYVFSRFPRVVRENAALLNKEIRLETKGAATELDKSLIERIIDPLTHLVRNSIDHGIEMPDVREAKGKSREGTLTLSAQHQGGHIVIEVKDDGGGLNREKVLKKALANGLTTNENISDDDLWQLLFAPGFSTAEAVTAISGRGVGMDVVRRNIQNMGGNVQMSSIEGKGTTTRVVLPLTLAILDGMSVRVGNEIFILPLSHVTESMQPTLEQMKNVTVDDRVMFVRGEYLPVISLGEVFDVHDYERDMTKSIAVVLQAEDMRFALIVDHLIGQHQVVVKNLEANYRKIDGVSAATILGDGSVALIVDVFAMHRLTRN